MVKPYFTRKNLMVIALSFFYALLIVFTGVCIDGAGAIVSKKNIINIIGLQMGFSSIALGTAGFVTLILMGIYIVVFVSAFCYIRRYAKLNGKNPYSFKLICIYLAMLVLCAVLSIGLGMLLQTNLGESRALLLKFISQAVLLATLLYLVLFGLVSFSTMLIINFLFVDKPFKFWNKKEEVVVEELEETKEDVTSNFDLTDAELAAGLGAGVGAAAGGNGNVEMANVSKAEELDDREKVFPALSTMDIQYSGYAIEKIETDDLSLQEICTRFRNYLAETEKLYFEEDTIRLFLSAFGTSHFMILEGLSGTGKSSLPRYFAKFCGANLLFVPVQTTWRDRSNMLGYFNDFSKTYTETDFLLQLYHANYNPDQLHFFVLDEMNISRVEYYFADFLSVLEYPVEEWRLRLMQIPFGFLPPAKLEDGFIQIMDNSYFVGTANKDDSTFSITDKVYDRAITIDFDYRNTPFTVEGDASPIKLSKTKLHSLYAEALNNEENKLTAEDYEKFETITNFVHEQFDLTFGNRILNQIETLVPIFMACGGNKESAIDFLFTRKVLAKLEGRFEEYVKNALKQLLALINKTYGKGVFVRSEKAINTLIRRL